MSRNAPMAIDSQYLTQYSLRRHLPNKVQIFFGNIVNQNCTNYCKNQPLIVSTTGKSKQAQWRLLFTTLHIVCAPLCNLRIGTIRIFVGMRIFELKPLFN